MPALPSRKELYFSTFHFVLHIFVEPLKTHERGSNTNDLMRH